MTEELKKEFSKLRFLDENGELYPEWEEKKYKNFLKISQEKPSESVDLNKLITVGWWGKGLTHSTKGVIFKEGATNFYPRREGQLVYSKQNLYKGAIDLVSSDFDGYLSSKDNPAFDFYGNSVDNRFILMFMLRPSYYKGLEKFSSGTGSKRVSEKIVLSMPLTLPSLPEQTKIADFLSKIDERIEAQAKLVELLKKQKQGYSQKIFNGSLRFKKDDGTDYDDWEEKKLGELIKLGGSGGTPSSTNKKYYGGQYPFLSISDITKQGKYLQSTEKSLTKSGIDNSGAWIVPSNSLIYAMYASVGKMCINKEPVTTSQALYSMSFGENVNLEFIYYYLTMFNLRNLRRLITTGTQSNINASSLRSFKINLPSLPEQEKIAAFLSSLDNRIDKQLNKLEQLKQEKQAYMQRVLG